MFKIIWLIYIYIYIIWLQFSSIVFKFNWTSHEHSSQYQFLNPSINFIWTSRPNLRGSKLPWPKCGGHIIRSSAGYSDRYLLSSFSNLFTRGNSIVSYDHRVHPDVYHENKMLVEYGRRASGVGIPISS